jgi:hypothetical protein
MEDDDTDLAETAGVDDDSEPSTGPEQGDELRGDIEEAIAKQRVDKGHPEPYRGLNGRTDAAPGGHYEGIDQYAKEAAKNGTTLKNALADYSAVEKAFRADPVKGFTYACQRLGYNPVAVAQALLRQGQQQPQTQAQQYQAQQYQAQAQAAYHQEYQRHASEVEAARRSMPYFDNLRPAMVRIAQSGRVHSVRQAYDLALKANPSFAMSAEIARRDAVRDRQMGRGKRR